MKERVGFIGIGLMGHPMAGRLAQQHEVIAYDTDPGRLAGLEGVTRAGSVREVASEASTVFLSLPSSAAVESVTLGDNGLEAFARAGSVVLDMSTTEPTVTRKIHERLLAKDVHFVDAPVSGGPAGASGGTLSIMVGCGTEIWDRVQALLAPLGSTIVRVGDSGSGGVAKLVNNMIVGAAFVSVTEGFALAAAHGVDIGVLHSAIGTGWAQSRVLDLSAAAVTKGDFAPTGTVDLLSKDLGYARSLARGSNVPIPVTAIVDEVFTAAKASGKGGNFQAVIVELWERLLGIGIAANADTRGTIESDAG
jgi:2-hydroxy-3-oxopropionate reductase